MDKKIVLSIDDNPVDINTFQGILVPKFILKAAKSASDALAFLNTHKADIILLDIEMPNICGFEFLKDIRRIPSYMMVPIIIVSSKTGQEFMTEARNSTAFDVLSKPVMPEKLIQVIEKALDSIG
jgi:two-component system chemotaxis response regulator CheY